MFSRLKNLFKKKEVIVPVVIKPRVRPASIWVNQQRTTPVTTEHFNSNDLLMAALILDSTENKPHAQPQYDDFVSNSGKFAGGGARDSWSYDTNTNTSSSSNDSYSSSSSDSYSSSDSSSSSSSGSD